MAAVEASIEGPISNVTADASGAGATVTALGVTIVFVPGTTSTGRKKTIKTPTVELSPAQLRSTAVFPGRTQPGFIGGTVIAEGRFDTGTNLFEADFLEVEPAETVLLGALTRNNPGTPRDIAINDVPVRMLTDTRLPSNPDTPASPIFFNQYGFPMKIETATLSPTGPTPDPPPAPTSAEGYFAGGVFHAFLFEYGGTGDLLIDPTTTPQLSIERAGYRDETTRVRYNARGHVTTSHVPLGSAPQNVQVFRVDLNPATGLLERMRLGSADIDTREAGFERWTFDEEGDNPGGFRDGAPLFILAVNNTGGAQKQIEPEVREA